MPFLLFLHAFFVRAWCDADEAFEGLDEITQIVESTVECDGRHRFATRKEFRRGALDSVGDEVFDGRGVRRLFEKATKIFRRKKSRKA